MRRRGWLIWTGLLLVGTTGVLLILLALLGTEHPASVPGHPNSEPIVPTRTPAQPSPPAPLPGGEGRWRATSTPAAVESPQITAPDPVDTGMLWQGRPRWGAGVVNGPILPRHVETLRLGWYLDWRAQPAPPLPEGVAYAQMIRLSEGRLWPDPGEISAIARANPGSLWLVGNEPDVKWQDNLEPAAYARLYHQAYVVVKSADPAAQVAIGGVSQPTPLRLRYLEAVLGAYREQFGAEMPVDVWNVHNFILREERGSWGVDIPPGMPDDQGMLYEVEDSANLEIFHRHIVDFRRWLARHGYQDRPLIVSEYGILMPEDYGFTPERVTAFLVSTFDIFLTATDPALGYPADGYRLVQSWCWYSLDASAGDYPTGALFDPRSGRLTGVGEGWKEYIHSLAE